MVDTVRPGRGTDGRSDRSARRPGVNAIGPAPTPTGDAVQVRLRRCPVRALGRPAALGRSAQPRRVDGVDRRSEHVVGVADAVDDVDRRPWLP